MGADDGLLYLNLDVPVGSDSHLSDVAPCLAFEVEYVIFPLDSGVTKHFCCVLSSKSSSW